MNRLFLLLFGAVTFVARAQVPDYVPTEGLVAWYPFNGNANDESGNGYDGVVQGASLSENRFGIENQSFSFDGMDDYISVSNDFNFNELTVSVWIKQNQFAETYSAIIDRSLTNNIGWWIEDNTVSYDSLLFTGGVASGNYFRTQAARPQPNAWTHIGALYSSGNQQLFINGVLVDQDVNSLMLQFPEVTMFLGKRTNSAFWDGSIDDVGIWNRALTEDEILALYNAEPPVPGCTDSTACNFDAEATSDDGSCIPSGCMEPEACNYNALAECEGEACDYTCCPGPGCCSAGMYWDYDLEQCLNYETCQEDLDGDGVIGINDLMELLSSFGTMCEEPETGEFTCGDPINYHGYDYATVQIGEQCWFAENVKFLPFLEEPNGVAGQAYVYDYFGNSADEAMTMTNYNVHGALYDFEAVINWPVCPSGWVVPSYSQFLELFNYLGGIENAANELLSSGYWPEIVNASNSSGFSSLPSGWKYTGFSEINLGTHLWTRTEYDAPRGHSFYLNEGTNWQFNHVGAGKFSAQSVRCLKDSE